MGVGNRNIETHVFQSSIVNKQEVKKRIPKQELKGIMDYIKYKVCDLKSVSFLVILMRFCLRNITGYKNLLLDQL